MAEYYDEAKCKINDKKWLCPIETCGATLSTKYVLRKHLKKIHNYENIGPTKRYKRYERNDEVGIPARTLRWQNAKRRRLIAGEDLEEDNGENITGDPGTSTADLTIVIDEDVRPSNEPEATNYSINHSLNETQSMLTTYSLENIGLEPHTDDPAEESDSDSMSLDSTEYVDLDPGHDAELECLPEQRREDWSDAPLYIMPPSETMHKSNISYTEHVNSVGAYCARHNLPDIAIKDLLELIQLHIPEQNIGEQDINHLKDECGFNGSMLFYNLYCDYCKKLYSGETDVCKTPNCKGNKADPLSKKYFVTTDLKKQTRDILQNTNIWEAIQYCKRRDNTSNVINDIQDGKRYKELCKEGGFLHRNNNITFTMFTDGVPLFSSSGVQIWPVYLLINELPPKERFNRKNMILHGIYQGVGKPNMNMFLRKLVEDLLDLYFEGVSIVVNSETLLVKAMLIIVTMDLQARAYMTCMTQHNGKGGCLFCEEPGESVESGKGHCRAYLVREQTMRTTESIKRHAEVAQTTGKRTEGFLGISVLSFLPYFSLCDNFVIDYLHGTLLGICKKMLDYWFDSKYSGSSFYMGHKVKTIDTILRRIRPPHMIHRFPRPISTYHHWKGSELRNWLLFYAGPCLKDVMDKTYYKHFCCLIEATYILLSSSITQNELTRARSMLNLFVQNMEMLYGRASLSQNVHNLTHMADKVEDWSQLYNWSCFVFESFNGEITSNVHSKGNICRQVFWKFYAQRQIYLNHKHIKNEGCREYIGRLLVDEKRNKTGIDAYQCTVVKPMPVSQNFSSELKQCLKKLKLSDRKSDFLESRRIKRNGHLMYGTSYTRAKKQNSTILSVQGFHTDVNAMEVNYFLIAKSNDYVYAVGKLFRSGESIMPNYITHLKEMEVKQTDAVVPVTYLDQPLVAISGIEEKHVYCALLPNMFERD